MNAPNTINDGFKLATKSFSYLWEHKLLLLFTLIPGILCALLDLVGFNVLTIQSGSQFAVLGGLHDGILALSQQGNWYYYSIMILFSYVKMLLRIFFWVALIYQTNQLLNENGYSLKETFCKTFSKWFNICVWAFIGMSMLYLAKMPTLPALLILVIFFIPLWYLFTFFVSPLIALTKKPLLKIIFESFRTTTKYIWIVIGGSLFFGILHSILFTLDVLLVNSNYLVLLIAYAFSRLIEALIIAVFTIFKTIVFRKIQPKDHSFDYLKQPSP